MTEDGVVNDGTGRARWAGRTDFGEVGNALSRAVAAARAQGSTPLDLTVSNPSRCGLRYDAPGLLGALARSESLSYRADPMGAETARRALAEVYYGGHGAQVSAEHLVLTASTSEGYGFLMRLLCDAGDEILVPEPSYPLLDLLARMHDVRLRAYQLQRHDGWRVDWQALRRQISSRTRAIVVVHPNNPTGHTFDAAERQVLQAVAAEFGLSLIVDEVFLDYPVEMHELPRTFAGNSPVLTFVLSGLSKVLALPQMKLAWIVVCGPLRDVDEAIERLGFIADTFLSVNGPVQQALPDWLPRAGAMQGQIVSRVRTNLAELDRLLEGGSCSRLAVAAGWSVVMRVPAVVPDEALAEALVRKAEVVVHPGSFYGLPERGWLVLSLLVPEATFKEGVTRALRVIEELANSEPPS